MEQRIGLLIHANELETGVRSPIKEHLSVDAADGVENDTSTIRNAATLVVQQNTELLNMPRNMEKSVRSHGPYKRIYKSEVNAKNSTLSGVMTGKSTGDDVIEIVTKTQQYQTRASPYPSIIRVPSAIESKFTVASYSQNSKQLLHSQMTLSRPIFSRHSSRYARSSSASSKNRLSGQDSENKPVLPSAENMVATPIIPFLKMTNSLQLYLKMNVLSKAETIVSWIPGSIIYQQDCLPSKTNDAFGLGILKSLVQSIALNGPSTEESSSSSVLPCYFLLTSESCYFFQPLFSLFNLKLPYKDEQTSYMDPSTLLRLVASFKHIDIIRVDVGASRQHITFRPKSIDSLTTSQSIVAPKAKLSQFRIPSLVLITYSRQVTTQLIDYLIQRLHDRDSYSRSVINQDIEYTLRNLVHSVFLQKNLKEVRVLSYGNVWTQNSAEHHDASKLLNLSENEYDKAAASEITKVDFTFLKFYFVCAYLRYFRPVPDSPHRSLKVEPISFVATTEYMYIVRERLDVWPPIIIPQEYTPHPSVNRVVDEYVAGKYGTQNAKGLVSDRIPQFDRVFGLGRVKDLVRIERWRTWRIDSSLHAPDEKKSAYFQGLGEALQNGFVGFFSVNSSKLDAEKQRGTVSGWFWWVRLIFGERASSNSSMSHLIPVSAPQSIPESNDRERVYYWWDLAFSTKDSVDELFDVIRKIRGDSPESGVLFINGDD